MEYRNNMRKFDLIERMLEEGKQLDRNVQYPSIIDIHPVLNSCNLKCKWCIGGASASAQSIKQYYANFDDFKPILDNIFDPSMIENHPKEIHICGNNSEPLLNVEFVKKTILYLRGKCKIKIITNGILLDKYMNELPFVDKINISVDVLSEKEFIEKKGGTKREYKAIFDNIRKISEMRIRKKLNMPILYSSFVIDGDYSLKKYNTTISKLKEIGVNHVQIRRNYYSENVDGLLEKKIELLKNKYNTTNSEYIDYNADTINTFDIKFNEKVERQQSNQDCYALYMWPAISANGRIYPCAHVANEENNDKGMSLIPDNNYNDLIRKYWCDKRTFKCNFSEYCPSNLNFLNTKLREHFKHIKINSNNIVFENERIKLEDINMMAFGKLIPSYIAVNVKRDSVVVLVKKEEKLLVTKNYRFLINKNSIELPAGEIEENESIINAAKREVLEETGIQIKNEQIISMIHPSNGITNQQIYIVFAEYESGNLKKQEDEIVNVYWMKKQEIENKIKNGEITDGPSIVSISFLNSMEAK